MAAPTVTWYPVTADGSGDPSQGSAITVVDFGSVQAGYFTDVKCVVANFSGNSAHTLKFWLYDTASEGANTNVSGGSSVTGGDETQTSAWKHRYTISDVFFDPDSSSLTDSIKLGTETNSIGTDFEPLIEEEPSTADQFITTTLVDGDNTDYIYLCINPPEDAEDGVTSGFGYRLSFLYP